MTTPTEFGGPVDRPVEVHRWPLVGRDPLRVHLQKLLESGQSALVTGDAGVGKSRLTHELAEEFRSDGRTTHLVRATVATKSVPLGAFLPLFAGGLPDSRDYAQLLLRLTDELTRSDDTPLLAIDDIDRLDDLSIALTHHLLIGNHVQAVATYRSDLEPSEVITDLWKDRGLARVVVDPLAVGAATELMTAITGAPLDPGTVSQVWEMSRGNPLYIRELVLHASSAGRLTIDSQGVGVLERRLELGDRLTALVDQRINELGPAERECLEAVAWSEPLDLPMALAMATPETLAQLERSHLLMVDETTDPHQVIVGHPLYAEQIRTATGPLERRRLCEELFRALAGSESALTSKIRLAVMGVRAEADLPTPLLEEAAGEALGAFDYELTLELASALPAGGFGREVLLGQALWGLNDFDESDVHFQAAARLTTTEAELVELVLTETENRVHRYTRMTPYIERVRALLDQVEDPQLRLRVEVTVAELMGWQGPWGRAFALMDPILERTDLDDEIRLRAHSLWCMSRSQVGPFDGLRDDIEIGLGLLHDTSTSHPVHELWLRAADINHCMFNIGPPAGIEAAAAHEREVIAGGGAIETAGMWAAMLGMSMSLAGDADAGAQHATRGAVSLELHDRVGAAAFGIGMQALCLVNAGDLDEAEAVLAHYRELLGDTSTKSRVLAMAAESTIIAHREGGVAAGELALSEGLQQLHHDDAPMWASYLLHYAVRFGRPDSVEAHLVEISERISGVTVLLTDHARAAMDRSVDQLLDVANRFAEVGFLPYAAEAADQAAEAATSTTGEPERAAALAVAAEWRKRQCPTFAFPVWRTAMPLSDREFEIAQLASEGRTSAEIAEKLFVARRTVDNHLGRVYRLTGLSSGRASLGELFV